MENIETKRASCLQTLLFQIKENLTYHVTVFVENVEHSILGANVFFAKEFVPSMDKEFVPSMDTNFNEAYTSIEIQSGSNMNFGKLELFH